jgi:hypothetical protein
MKTVIRFLLVVMFTVTARAHPGSEWMTEFEASGGTKTPRYDETVAYCKRLARASSWVHYTSFGVSPQGRPLPLVILSRERAFSPALAARNGKAVILVQSCIHAGECDGKDASLMLMREIAVTRARAHLLDHAIILFVPIFNVDGHERFGSYNRINQNGPVDAGWRVTAQDLNLNRDYLKADAPEMRAMLRLFASWLPDLYVDCHVTDGMDFQYDVTYAVEYAANIEPVVSRWVKQSLIPGVLPHVEASGHRIFYYVSPREDHDLSKGLVGGAATPRFSTGYAAVQNRPAFLIETHMLKPYKVRVEATFAVLEGICQTVNRSYRELRGAVRTADEATIDAGKTYDAAKTFPLRLKIGDSYVLRDFLGIRTMREPSAVSGGSRTVYTGEPVEMKVPYYEDMMVTDSVAIPLAYLVPPEWTKVADVLRAHSIRLGVLQNDVTLPVESYRFSNIRWRSQPYEGRHPVTYNTEVISQRRTFHRGTLVVPMDQRAARVAIHLLEPAGPDALVSWGFFDAIFEQKEYSEDYVMERVGAQLLAEDPALRQEFDEKIKADSSFAGSPSARLNWLYLHSPWADPLLNIYPVGRVTDREAMGVCRRWTRMEEAH